MKHLTPISLLFLFIAFSCAEKSKKIAKKEVRKMHILVKTDEVKANRLLTATIEGMVCEKGCGSSIRKELLHTNAVESCEFDYQSDRKTNTVKISFDKDKISADKIVSILNTMNEKQFKVLETRTENYESKIAFCPYLRKKCHQQKDISSLNSDEAKVKVSDTLAETPNLLQIFSRLITG